MSLRISSASPACPELELYHGACIITTNHGVAARSTAAKSRTSQACWSEPASVAAYDDSEMRCSGPTARDHHKLLGEPDDLVVPAAAHHGHRRGEGLHQPGVAVPPRVEAVGVREVARKEDE